MVPNQPVGDDCILPVFKDRIHREGAVTNYKICYMCLCITLACLSQVKTTKFLLKVETLMYIQMTVKRRLALLTVNHCTGS